MNYDFRRRKRKQGADWPTARSAFVSNSVSRQMVERRLNVFFQASLSYQPWDGRGAEQIFELKYKKKCWICSLYNVHEHLLNVCYLSTSAAKALGCSTRELNNATSETSYDITPFHLFHYFNLLSFITWYKNTNMSSSTFITGRGSSHSVWLVGHR